MGLLKKILFLGILFMISSIYFVSANEPPQLPTRAYGKVVSDEGKGVAGLSVVASWIDANGIAKSVNSITDTEGNYFFNSGEINAEDGKEITIFCSGISVKINAKPGALIEVNTIKMSLSIYFGNEKEEKGFFGELAANFVSFFFGKRDSDYSSNGESFSNYSVNGSDTRTTENSALADDYTSENVTDSSDSNYSQSNSINNSVANSLKEGEVNSSTGNNSIRTFSNDSGKQLKREGGQPVSTKYSSNLSNNSTYDNKWYFSIGFYLLLIALIFVIVILFFIFKFLTYVVKKISLKQNSKRKIKDIYDILAEYIMSKDLTLLDIGSNALDAAGLFVQNSVNVIFIMDGKKLIGVLTKKIFVKNLSEIGTNLEKVKIRDILQKNFSRCLKDEGLKEIIKLMKGSEEEFLAVFDGKKLVGIIESFDLINILRYAKFSIDNPPLLNEVMKKELVYVDKEINLIELRKVFMKNDVSYALVKEDKNFVGITTIKDFVVSLSNGLDLKKTTVKDIMSLKIISMNPGESVYAAFNLISEKRFNQIPLKIEGKIIGIVFVDDVVMSFYECLEHLESLNEEKDR